MGKKGRRKKVPSSLNNPQNSSQGKRIPSQNSQPVSTTQSQVKWSTKLIDTGYCGDWDWDLSPNEIKALLSFLEDVANKTWGEITSELVGSGKHGSRHHKHHDQGIDTLCSDAQDRLAVHLANQELPETLFRFRLSGKTRLWGTRTREVFNIVWFDRNHCVYPTSKGR